MYFKRKNKQTLYDDWYVSFTKAVSKEVQNGDKLLSNENQMQVGKKKQKPGGSAISRAIYLTERALFQKITQEDFYSWMHPGCHLLYLI